MVKEAKKASMKSGTSRQTLSSELSSNLLTLYCDNIKPSKLFVCSPDTLVSTVVRQMYTCVTQYAIPTDFCLVKTNNAKTVLPLSSTLSSLKIMSGTHFTGKTILFQVFHS